MAADRGIPEAPGDGDKPRLRLFEIALVLVRFDHVASGIVNANHGTALMETMQKVPPLPANYKFE